jgi:hypothetical protein
MLCLRDVVEIDAPPERVFDWFQHLDENYRSWHPDHVSCRYLEGSALEDGSVLYAEEYLHGRLHRLKFTLVEVIPGRELHYRIFPGLSGGFRIRPTDRGTELVAEIFLGWSIPLIGALLDAALRALLSRHIDAIRQHMNEEGVNLKTLLSPASSSAPI